MGDYFRVDSATHRRVKIESAQRGIEMKDLVRAAIEQYLDGAAAIEPDGTAVLIKVPAELAPIVRGFLELLLKHGADEVREQVRRVAEGGTKAG